MAISRLSGLLLWQVQGSEDSRCLSLSRKGLITFNDRSRSCSNQNAGRAADPVELPFVNLLDASHNKLSNIKGMLDIVPSAWWINLRDNKLGNLNRKSLNPLPMAMGSLDLSENALTMDALEHLYHAHILRLTLFEDESLMQQRQVLGMLPNTWVLNGAYYSVKERIQMEASLEAAGLQKTLESHTVSLASAGSIIQADGSGELPLNGAEGRGGSDFGFDLSQTMRQSPHSISHAPDTSIISDEISQCSLADSPDAKDAWAGARTPGNREGAFLGALHTFAPNASYTLDFYRLDVLLEDYIEEAILANQNKVPYLGSDQKRYPVVDAFKLVMLPRKIKMDLSVLLGISILFPLPKDLVNDTVLRLLINSMSATEALDVLAMPTFARTAMATLLRRALFKEEEELRQYGMLIDKSILHVPKHTMEEIQTFTGTAKGWKHLHAALKYLHTSVNDLEILLHKHNGASNASRIKPGPVSVESFSTNNSESRSQNSLENFSVDSLTESLESSDRSSLPHRFSSLDFQLLTVIPDIITPAVHLFNKEHAKNSQWLNFASRHVVVMLAKSDLCPNLMKSQSSTKLQDTYCELLPLLKSAKMTLSNLADENAFDNGRIDNDKAISENDRKLVEEELVGETNLTKGMPDDDESLAAVPTAVVPQTKHTSQSKVKRVALLTGHALSYGTGLPKGDSSMLRWNQEDQEITRNYDVWNDYQYSGGERNEMRKMQTEQQRVLDRQFKLFRRGKGPASPPPKAVHSFYMKPSESKIGNQDDVSLASLALNSIDSGGEQVKHVKPTQVDNAAVIEHNSMVVQLPSNSITKDDENSVRSRIKLQQYDIMNDDDPMPIKSVNAEPSIDLSLHSGFGPDILEGSQITGPNTQVPPTQALSPTCASPTGLDLSPNKSHQKRQMQSLSPSVISGFSVNASRESKFLLATTTKALQNNRKADAAGKLSVLHHAPVLVHPTSPGILPVPSYVNGSSEMIDQEENKRLGYKSPGIENDSVGSTVDTVSTYNPASSARNLLAEMGTLRNIRNLLIDDGSYQVPPSRVAGTLGTGDLTTSSNIQRMSAMQGNIESTTFLTAPGVASISQSVNIDDRTQYELHRSEASNNVSSAKADAHSPMKQKKPPKIFKARQLDTLVTSADLQKIKTSYANIFTVAEIPEKRGYTNNAKTNRRGNTGSGAGQQAGMRNAELTADGRPMSANWYPVPEKPTFTLAPSTSDSIDLALRALYGSTELPPQKTSNRQKISKKKNQVTYTTAKLRVSDSRLNNIKASGDLRANGIKVTSSGVQTGIADGNPFEGFQTSIQAAPPPDDAELRNVVTGLQPRVKTNFKYTLGNYDNDESSLKGTRENYKATTNLKLSAAFRVTQSDHCEDMTGIGNSLFSC